MSAEFQYQPGDRVILLHGLGRSRWAMWRLQRFLQRQGMSVYNVSYPSRSMSIEKLAEHVWAQLERTCVHASRWHFVTHSMGGILVRQALQQGLMAPTRCGLVIMLAPPSQGSELVDQLRQLPLIGPVVGPLMGPAFLQLGTDQHSVPQQLLQHERRSLPVPVGVIAGSQAVEPWARWVFDDANDGKVAVSRARLPGMSEFRVVDTGHTFIMDHRRVREQVLYFLRHGHFL